MRWFGGQHRVDHDYSLHLQKLLQVISDDDDDLHQEIDLVQAVMRKLREVQESEFTKHGYLQRQIGYPEPDDLNTVGETVEVTVPCGRRAWAAFKAKEIDGSFINGSTESGLLVNLDNSAEVAREIAAKYFDDPIIVTLRVPQGTIQNGRIYSRYSLSFGEDRITPVAFESYDKSPRVDLQFNYPTLDEEQTSRLEALLYDDRSPPTPPRPPTPPTPEPTQRPPTPPSQNNPQPSEIPIKKIVWVAAGVLMGYLIVTRVGSKVNQMMQEKPLTSPTENWKLLLLTDVKNNFIYCFFCQRKTKMS